jgi:uncharacterized surface protein with fasciclin (FAS1) repeats
MKLQQLYLLAILVASLSISCKNETTEAPADEPTVVPQIEKIEKVEKREVTKPQNDQLRSLWAKLSMRPDTKNFIRLMTSASLADTLLIASSEFTIFAPSNASFSVFTERMNITNNPAQRKELVTLLKNHMVAGSMNSADLVQAIKKDGKVVLTTLAGEKLTVTMDGDAIVVATKGGATATVNNSDITASNGVLHVINAVLKE